MISVIFPSLLRLTEGGLVYKWAGDEVSGGSSRNTATTTTGPPAITLQHLQVQHYTNNFTHHDNFTHQEISLMTLCFCILVSFTFNSPCVPRVKVLLMSSSTLPSPVLFHLHVILRE